MRTIAQRIEDQMTRLLPPGDVVEVRAIGVTLPDQPPRTALSGYFNNVADLARAAASLDGFARGIYFTLNPLKPECLERAENRLEPGAAAATDADVVRRRWLPLDFDPVRPKDSNATEDELDAAVERADLVWRQLRRRRWPEPIPAFSGNGVHLLFPVDLPSDDGGIIRQVLHRLSGEFSDDVVQLDKCVHNPSRIWKVYGTTPRKGTATPDRPLRPAILMKRGSAA